MLDTLSLICRGIGSAGPSTDITFIITKGSQPPTLATITNASPYASLTIANVPSLIYSDFDGLQQGYENIVVIPSAYNTYVGSLAKYVYRYVTIGTLRPTDSGTYHCSAGIGPGGIANYFATSGGLTITVNTKPGQARSARVHVNNFLAYSTALLGASKLLF